jgi:folate-dependent phosphoribosylglycinamide formyltransferase PurN
MHAIPYSTVVFCSNDIFSAILLRGLMACNAFSVEKIYIEKECMGYNGPFSVFRKVVKRSGFRYAIYQSVEVLAYAFLAKVAPIIFRAPLRLPIDECKNRAIPFQYIDATVISEGFKHHKEYDVLFCFRFSKILKARLLSIAKVASVNFHGALLPKYAGLGSIFQAVSHRENEIGGSFHVMVEKIDSGKVIYQSKFPINYQRSVGYHHLKVYQESAKGFFQVAYNLKKQIAVANDSAEDEYFSFPEKSAVKKFSGSLFDIRDLFFAVKIIASEKNKKEET